MKKTIFAVFAAVLCLCALCAVVVSAENAPETDIVAHNLALNDSVNIIYYADFQNVPENAEKGILIWTLAQDEYIYGSENAKLTNVRGISAGYTTYAFTGVSAKMMSQDIYAKSYIKVGDEITYGPLDKYSVLQYCYNKKSSTSTVGGGTKTLGELVGKMLEYGAFAQEYFNYNTDRMADATYYTVEVVNGTLPDGMTSGIYPAGKKLTLVADIPYGETFAYWQNADGESVGNNENLTITVGVGNQTYTAVYGIVAPVDEHNYGAWIAEVPATCTENGTKGHYLCSHCGEYFDETFNVIDDLTILSTGEHNYGEWQTLSAPTCVNGGIEARQCTNCGVYDRRNLPALGHDYGEWIINKEATCTENGERMRACSRCGILQRETIYSPGHQFGNWVTVKAATCEKGFEERTCSVCGKVERNWLPADYTSHVWGEETCTVCGEHKASEGLQYELINGDELAIWGYTGSDTTVYLPSSYIGCVVTTIRAEAFKDQTQITEIVIPESIKTIENDAFNGCSHLKNLQIQNPSVSIRSGAFSGCISLENVTIPTYAIGGISKDKLKTVVLTGGTSIGNSAFSGCSSLTSIEIPASVTSIGYRAFKGCSSLTSVTFAENSQLTSIGDSAFSGCSSLTSIEIPSSVTSIGYAAFFYCSSLTSITFAENSQLTSIGNDAFSACSSLTSIEIPEGVTSIGNCAFENCSSLTSITIPFVGAKAGVTSSSTYQYPFGYIFGTSSYTGGKATTQYYYGSSTSSTTSSTYYIPSSLKTVTVTGGYIPYGAFYNCSGLTSITIGEGVTSIGEWAFYGCSSLTSITVAEGNTVYHSAGNCLIETESKTLMAGCKNSVIPTDGSVTSIGDAAFYGCSSLTSIEIPEGVTSIGSFAFYNCSKLTSIEIPASVTSIGDAAFYGCSSLTSITFAENSQLTSIGDCAFYCCDSLYRVINKSNLNFTIGSSNNGYVAYYAKILVDKNGNTTYKNDGYRNIVTDDEFLFREKDNTYTLIAYLGNEETVTLPESIEGSNYSIYYMRGVHKVIIPSSVTSIGESAFWDCSSLTSIEIPEGVTSIGERAFYNCSKLTSVTIGNSVTSIGNSAFSGCSSLTSIEIPASVTSIGNDAFRGCSSLTSIDIPSSVTSIGNSAFYNCRSLTSVTIGSSVTSIGGYAFYECSSLTSIEIPEGVTSIGERAFYNCSSLTSIEIPESVTSIGWYAFYNCSSLTSINYNGTKEQWNAISKGYNWNNYTGNYTVYCTDGNIAK